jgi:hypothetical protein
MKFDKLIEDFNIFPKDQNAVQSGPDAGITTGSIEKTFPNRGGIVMGDLLPNDIEIILNKTLAKKLLKLLPKEKLSKIR